MTSPESLGVQGGRNDLLRRHNLGLVLRSVHLAPKTRSALTRISGLNRSTIGALVADLAARELVVEDEASPLGQVGRPSPVVRPSDVPMAIAVNPEVDAVTVATVLLGGRVLEKERVPFDDVPSPTAAVAAAAAAAERLVRRSGSGRPVGIGAAVPGIVQQGEGIVRNAPHLGWHDVPLGRMLTDAIGVPARVANDASVGAQAEWVFGAGRGVDDLIYLHAGASGIGAGVICDGRPLFGATGHVGELGHTTVRRHGPRDTIGLRGTLEAEVTRERLLKALELDRADPDELEQALIRSDSPEVKAEVGRQLDFLAIAIANAVNLLNPARFVLGGFLSALVAVDRPRLVRAVIERTLPLPGEAVEIVQAELGSDLLLIAAAELPFARLFADPLAVAV
jgi:predicted NBD/HSP70 family sugar kinase